MKRWNIVSKNLRKYEFSEEYRNIGYMSSSTSGKLISWAIPLSPMAKAMEISKATLTT
ncbi:hypothetical protein [Methanosarcina barkeri]|uniref:hypothetical protein n=1 Tax=Methanosarcina barkeri TaxID=2208 RepID=UPI000B0EF636|nr:hypothetical protein [Methanosarcina barkeri]